MTPFFAAIAPKLAAEAAGAVSTVLKHFLPTKLSEGERAAIERETRNELLQRDSMELQAVVELARQQTEINKVEAASARFFISGWRPFVGWVCGLGLAFASIGAPLLTWASDLYGTRVDFPVFDNATLTSLLFGLLGLGALRTAEKVKGVA